MKLWTKFRRSVPRRPPPPAMMPSPPKALHNGGQEDDGSTANGIPVLDGLLSFLEGASPTSKDDLFLKTLLRSRSLQALVAIHNVIDCLDASPINDHLQTLAKEVLNVLYPVPLPEARELSHLLSLPHVQALIEAHDQVARKEFLPTLPAVPSLANHDAIKIVQLIKNKEPLGATVKYDENTSSLIVAHVLPGGAAERSGLIYVGDEVREVNGISVKGKSRPDVLEVLEQVRDGPIVLTLVPHTHRKDASHMRAHFTTDPTKDPEIPCGDVGLAFSRGDVLVVVNREDRHWWLAYKDGEPPAKTGLIPSPGLQQRRIASSFNSCAICSDMFQTNVFAYNQCSLKVSYTITSSPDLSSKNIITYTPVAKLHPSDSQYHRPIVLIGPPGVGRNELKQKLVLSNPDHFRTTIPFTSRAQQDWEHDGQEYHFVDRDFMEEEILRGKFVEYGQFRNHLYGTSLDMVLDIVRDGFVCVINPIPQALPRLYTPELKPYVIFIKPPSLEVLKECRQCPNFSTCCSHIPAYHHFNDEECEELVDTAHKIEQVYGHMFDLTVVNDDLPRAFQELLVAARLVELEAQWVPADWLN